MVVVPGERVRVRGSAKVTYLLVLANTLIYLYTSYPYMFLQSTEESVYSLGFIPALLFTNPIQGVVRVFTSMFTHADIFHIFFNMYLLWLFGKSVEGYLGSRKYLSLYMLSGIAATLFYVAIIPVGGYDSLVIPAIGASGAISGVLGSYLLLFPHTRLIWCMFFLFPPYCIPVPASLFLVVWFAEQVIYGYARLGGVAFFAHVGGFIAGIAMTYLIARRASRQYAYWAFSSLYDWYRSIGVIFTGRRGLGKITKAVLIIFLVAVAAGFAYSLYTLTSEPPLTYIMRAQASSGTATASDTVSLVVYRDGGVEISYSPVDVVRILLGGMQPYIYNPSLSGESLVIDATYSVTIRGLTVPVELHANASYDSSGVILYGSGWMNTRVVNIRVSSLGESAVLGNPITINFELHSERLRMETALSLGGIASLALTILAIISVKKADEVSAFTEEYTYIPPLL